MFSASSILWKFKEGSHPAHVAPVRWLCILLYEVGQYFSGGGIDWRAKFDGKPCLPHGVRGVFVSRYAKVGTNCVIFQQVTIGSNTLADSKGMGAPVIGNDCFIGAGAKIIGNVTIGDHVRIGANCVVHDSVPDNSVLMAGDPKVIQREDLDNRFFTRRGGIWVYYKDGAWIEEKDPGVVDRLSGAMP